MTHIQSLSLNAFRNYDSATVNGLGNGFVILIGNNGAGKTNCLEGISLLSPGRGLRGASVAECQSSTAKTPWVVSATLSDSQNNRTQLGIGRDPQKRDKKIIRANGTPVKSQQDLGEIMRAVWLTPQMDGLFLQGASERRRFFDRLVATFDPAHSGRLTRFEKATRERLNILKTAAEKNISADALWLDGLENVMAETSVAIAAARLDMVGMLDAKLATQNHTDFPRPTLSFINGVEETLGKMPALSVEDHLRDRLSATRAKDTITQRTETGAHRSDFSVIYTDKNTNAANCSTGEQKSFLTSIILAHAGCVASRFGAPPLLLFDEVCAHFDTARRDALFDILGDVGGQIWMSGQDAQSFQTINNKQILTIKQNKIES